MFMICLLLQLVHFLYVQGLFTLTAGSFLYVQGLFTITAGSFLYVQGLFTLTAGPFFVCSRFVYSYR